MERIMLKCRIVAGHQQSFGTYSEVSAPTADMSSVFMLLSMNKYLSSVDFPMAYLNATLNETIFMKLTHDISTIYIRKHPEFAQHVDNRGCLCVKCLYGLTQSELAWRYELTSTLVNQGQSTGDACFFYNVHIVDGKNNYLSCWTFGLHRQFKWPNVSKIW